MENDDTSSVSARRRAIAEAFAETRDRTLAIASLITGEARTVRPHEGYSPFDWHLGHIGYTEALWSLRASGRAWSFDPTLEAIFENTPANPKGRRTNLPDRETILTYLAGVRARVLEALSNADLQSGDPLRHDGFQFTFPIAHECQHQETMIELCYLLARQAQPGEDAALPTRMSPERCLSVTECVVPAGEFRMGADNPHAYDNERPAHKVSLPAFAINATPVTLAQFERFRSDGGYCRESLWSSEGWAWLQAHPVDRPEHWRQGPTGVREPDPDEPVMGVNWFEANAYATWAGKRLPTEEEWEKAAAGDPSTGQTRIYPWGDAEASTERADYDGLARAPSPVGSRPAGRSASGAFDMAGGVWEWTSSIFAPYEGFVAWPYEGYSKDWFDGEHRVLKGGSWATRGPLLRCSFRNFYRPEYRQGFLGFRCARSM